MTQPREHDAVTSDEPVGTWPAEPPKPDTGAWYPVDQPPQVGESEPEPTPPAASEAEPTAEPEPAAGATDVTEPVTLAERERPEEVGAESSLEPADAEPTRPVEGPVPVLGEPSADAEPTRPVEGPVPVLGEPSADAEPTRPVEGPVQLPEESPTADERTSVLPEAETAELEDSRTQRLHLGEEAAPVAGAPADAIFRPASPTPSPAEPTRIEPVSEEERKLAAERAARREARAAALAAPPPAPVVEPTTVVVHKRTNDKFWGALGLFLLRWVLAAIFAIRGLNILTDLPATQAAIARTVIPEPGIMAVVAGVACELIALSLLLGLLTRAAGLGIALIAGGALAFVYWGPWSIFVPGQPGFLGEYELLLATVGILLLLIGGGGWSLDRAFRAGRERDRRERAAAAE